MFQLWASSGAVAEKITSLPIKAPPQLDLNQVQRWVNGSVWALLSLNLVALVIFLGNSLYPQLFRLASGLKTLITDLRKKKEKPVAAAPTTAASDLSAVAEPSVTEVISQVEEVFEQPQQAVASEPPPAAPTSSDPAPATPEVEAEATVLEPEAPPPPADASPEVAPSPGDGANASSPSEVVADGITEEVDLPKVPEEQPVFTEAPNTLVLSEPAPNPNEITEILPKSDEPTAQAEPPPSEVALAPEAPTPPLEGVAPSPEETVPPPESPPLPDAGLSGQTLETAMPSAAESLKSIEDTLTEALAGVTDATEELSVFDPSAIDAALQQDQPEEQKK